MKPCVMLVLVAFSTYALGQWRVQPSGTKAQFRGMSIVSPSVGWLAGSMGTFGRMVDGKNWNCSQIPGSEKLNFRSVVGFDANHAVLLAIGPGEQSKILVTADGGHSWSIQWVNSNPRAFFDSVAFWDSLHGICLSDPVDGRFPLIETSDGGLHWTPIEVASMPSALIGEGAFSASGTCMVVQGTSNVWIATGGASMSRVFRSRDRGRNWEVSETPIPAGIETAGIFGLRFQDLRRGIAVGGDYKQPTLGGRQISFTTDGGRTWRFSSRLFPMGLRESASYIGNRILLVGPEGSDISDDGGRSWLAIVGTPRGLHTCEFSGDSGWAAGDNGLIAVWEPGSKRLRH